MRIPNVLKKFKLWADLRLRKSKAETAEQVVCAACCPRDGSPEPDPSPDPKDDPPSGCFAGAVAKKLNKRTDYSEKTGSFDKSDIPEANEIGGEYEPRKDNYDEKASGEVSTK